jgi:hypothetical protein
MIGLTFLELAIIAAVAAMIGHQAGRIRSDIIVVTYGAAVLARRAGRRAYAVAADILNAGRVRTW